MSTLKERFYEKYIELSESDRIVIKAICQENWRFCYGQIKANTPLGKKILRELSKEGKI